MTEADYKAEFATINQKSTNELLNIVDNHLNDHPEDYQRMVAVILSIRNVQFNIDKFPPGLCDKLYYYENKNKWRVWLIIIDLILLIGSYEIAFHFYDLFFFLCFLTLTFYLLIGAFCICIMPLRRKIEVRCTGVHASEPQNSQCATPETCCDNEEDTPQPTVTKKFFTKQTITLLIMYAVSYIVHLHSISAYNDLGYLRKLMPFIGNKVYCLVTMIITQFLFTFLFWKIFLWLKNRSKRESIIAYASLAFWIIQFVIFIFAVYWEIDGIVHSICYY